MKIKSKILITTAFIFEAILQIHAQGYLVPNGVSTNLIAGEISVIHDPTTAPAGGSYTGFYLHPQSANTFQFDPVVDIGVRVFFVSPNDPITANTILSGNYTELLSPNIYSFDNGSPFYVGLYTGNVSSAPQNGIYNDPLFGWAQLVNNNGTIQLLNSALEYQGGGIYAGTQTIIPVPEPSALSLLALGGLFLGWRRLALPRFGKT